MVKVANRNTYEGWTRKAEGFELGVVAYDSEASAELLSV